MNRSGSPVRDRRRFGLLCVLVYVALSWTARYDMRRGDQIASLLYPLDTFSMYAGRPAGEMSHLLVRDRQGIAYRVTAFRSFDCAEPLSGSAVRCADKRGFQYHYDDLINYVQSHAGPGDVEVELISRTWALRPGAAPVHTSDCVIARCTASR